MNVAYEHIRQKRQGNISAEMCKKRLEYELHNIRFDETGEKSEEYREPTVDDDDAVMRYIFGDEHAEQSLESRTSFLAYVVGIGDPILDICKKEAEGPSKEMEELRSNELQVLPDVYKSVGGKAPEGESGSSR